jgi:HypF finger
VFHLAHLAEMHRDRLKPAGREYDSVRALAVLPWKPIDFVSSLAAPFRVLASGSSRRFHVQPNAYPSCGPRLAVEVADVAQALRDGSIVALKGVGVILPFRPSTTC